jgi:uncharacterized protein
MKLHLNTTVGQNTIFGHGAGYVDINGTRHSSPVIVAPNLLISPWEIGDFASLSFADFADLVAQKPAIVVFGSGATFRFPNTQLLAAFSQARIGFDVMDTPAACRTYNVLMSEGRNVAAVLLV